MQLRTPADVLTFTSNQPFMVEGIAFSVIETARELFEAIGHLEDFGIQYASDQRIIFGGLNRVIWSIKKGFRVDPNLSTEDFKALFEKELQSW